jgi:nitrogen fixation/metabolism regulation signal transduction histidine kinase
MKIQTKLLIVVFFLSVLSTAPAVVLYFRSLAFDKTFSQIPQAVNTVANAAELNSLSQYIRYYDEVLTQSARNYAFTGDVFWKTRYLTASDQLTATINKALALGTDADKQIFDQVNSSNDALVAMEEESFSLVESGNRQAAIDLLNSQNYTTQKSIYAKALETYAADQGKGYNDTLTVSTNIVNTALAASKQNLSVDAVITLLIAFLCIAAGFTVYFFIRSFVFKPLEKLTKATEEIAKGNLTYQIGSNKNDEIGKLSDSFDQMATNLRESRQNIEQKVTDRTADLTKLNKAMVGRELAMIELKKKLTQK